MLLKLAKILWGDVSKKELKKFGILSLALLFIIVTYWIVRPIKDALFLSLVGKTLLPYAKIVSLISLIIFLMIYAKLVDLLANHRLVYFLNLLTCLFFFTLAIIILKIPNFSTQNLYISQIIGWVAFVGSECLLAIQFNLFWSFVVSSMDTQTAKKGYPIIIAGAQIGGIVGPFLTMKVGSVGIVALLFTAGFLILGVAIIIKFFTFIHSHIFNNIVLERKKETGAIEGLHLLIKQPYLIGILLISILPDIIGEIFNISMLFLVENSFKTPEKIIAFLGIYGLLVNTASFIFAFFGTSFFLRTWGLAAGLLFNPLIIAVIVIYTWVFYSLWSVVMAMVVLKGLEHALDQPCREIMFIPTSRDIMFKSKSWISVFGGRFARGIGAGSVALFVSMGNLIFYSSLISLSLVVLWMPIAWFVGETNKQLVQEGKILE
jgi:AAA family ATP:ADP antiporter